MYTRDFDYTDNKGVNKLSVLLMADSFFYGVLDAKNSILCHRSFGELRFSNLDTITDLLADSYLKREYQSISVVVLDGESLQLPEEDAQFVEVIPQYRYKVKKVEKITGNDIYNYFGISPAQQSVLDGLFGSNKYKITHVSSLLASYFVGDLSNFLYTHVEGNSIFIYAQKNGSMVFFNSFPINGMHDVLYFILSVCKFSDFDPTEDKVFLGGWIEMESVIFNLLKGYIRRLELIKIFNHTLHEKAANDLKPHYYFLHFANIECAL